MSFVSKIVQLSDSVKMRKPYYKYNIKEMDVLLSDYFYKEESFVKTREETKNYMKRVGIIKNTWLFLKLNVCLIDRLIRKRNKRYEE